MNFFDQMIAQMWKMCPFNDDKEETRVFQLQPDAEGATLMADPG